MKYIANLSPGDFEALCREIFAEHASRVCNPVQFTLPMPPHYSDFPPECFRFARWDNELASFWICGYVIPDHGYINTFVLVWHCKYLHPQELGALSRPEDVGKAIARSFEGILRAFERNNAYGLFGDHPFIHIHYIVITNTALHPAEGDPSLYNALWDIVRAGVPGLASLQVGTAATIPFQSARRCVYAVEVTPLVLGWLGQDVRRICSLSPEEFELLIADCLSKMGFGVRKVGAANRRDGGIDILAWPEKREFPFLLAVQAKHHSEMHRMGGPVSRQGTAWSAGGHSRRYSGFGD